MAVPKANVGSLLRAAGDPEGFPDRIIKIVEENADALHFRVDFEPNRRVAAPDSSLPL